MKLLAVTYGTEGDTRPVAALCRALVDAGHDVRLLADASTLPFADRLGLSTRPLAGNVRDALTGIRLSDTPFVLTALANDHTTEWLDVVLEEAPGCDAIIVSGLAGFVGLSAAEATGIKIIGAMLLPLTPTRQFPMPFFPIALPKWLNPLSHTVLNNLVWGTMRKATNLARRAHGLPPRGMVVWSGHPMAYGVSPALLPRPDDYPPNAWHTGQWVPPHNGYTPSAELAAFLAAGEKPIYVGFGSMAGFDPMLLHHVVAPALGERRAIFSRGWSTVDTESLPPNIFLVDSVPHDWLLPHCAMAVHHGGSGTTHSACAAGVPSIILSFGFDQSFWARHMVQLGIADEVLDVHAVTREQLFAAIAFADGPRAQARASELGLAMRQEDGLGVAVRLIERIAGAGEVAGHSMS
ncbi:hypothetical protein CspeluHIS016_0202580 [Cutaneotrichosporon spelunceum]|uniref:Erythromycin biosynthesis protein CIII-like C-terminal domain-containing protein n=1 Tax=Cutaneotrichosporon spelunceum TaxID=1672016 RepID=A0AAD3TQX4_9TREE|nr:hypothetical protein CspeluHIS016_0202580 [Cutaneotrichosporon spelunceum]